MTDLLEPPLTYTERDPLCQDIYDGDSLLMTDGFVMEEVLPPTWVTNYWEATELVLNDGDPVASWSDNTSTYTFLQADSTRQPTYGVDGDRAYVDFNLSDEVADYMTSSLTLAQPFTLVIAMGTPDTNIEFYIAGDIDSTAYAGLYATTNARIYAGSSLGSTVPIASGEHIIGGVFNDASSIIMYDDTFDSGTIGTNGLVNARLGWNVNSPTYSATCQIFGVYVANTNVSQLNLEELSVYTRYKWGIP